MYKDMNRYVKVKGHSNWFLTLESNENEPNGLSGIMQEKILRSVCTLHDPDTKLDFTHRAVMAATRNIDYESLSKKYGTILIRPTGTFMPLHGNEVIEEAFDLNFPIEDFAEIVICENDQRAESKWVNYLKSRFNGKKITTINYFDLRTDNEVETYFKNAKYITFSTTFSTYSWFKKLTKFSNSNHVIIGYCHTKENWNKALEINSNIEIVTTI